MEATIDTAIASIIFILSISILFSIGYSSAFSYLEYIDDVSIKARSQLLSNMIKSIISGSQEGIWKLNKNYGNGLSTDLFSDMGINFVLDISFVNKLNIESMDGSKYVVSDSPVNVIIYNPLTDEVQIKTTPAKLDSSSLVILSRYGALVGEGLTLDKELVKLEGDVIKTKDEKAYKGYIFSEEPRKGIQVLNKMSVKDLGSPLVIVNGDKYIILPPIYPWKSIVYIGGEFKDSGVSIPPEAVYFSSIAITSMDVPVLVEVWVWSAPS